MDQRAILITGASSGIGYVSAEYLSTQGFKVYAGVRKQKDADRIQSEHQGRIIPVIVDVTDQASRNQAYAFIEEDLAGQALYALINNAGITYASPLEYVDQTHIERQLNTNFTGVALMTAEFLPLIHKDQKGGKGRVINVSSGAGHLSVPLMGIYAASKFALEGMSDALRVELRQSDIHVSVVVPGAIKTPIHEKNNEDLTDMLNTLPPEGKSKYRRAIETYQKHMNKQQRNAVPSLTVAKSIESALNDKKPKARYYAGPDSRMLSFAKPFLTDGLRDRIVRNMTGL